MAELNGRYRGEKKATDVLAFPMRGEVDMGLLGDVVISVETVQCQISQKKASGIGSYAVREGGPLGEEILRLLVHGTLHLLGYDHHDAASARKMRAQERMCLQKLIGKE